MNKRISLNGSNWLFKDYYGEVARCVSLNDLPRILALKSSRLGRRTGTGAFEGKFALGGVPAAEDRGSSCSTTR